jgi:hypothetical protein
MATFTVPITVDNLAGSTNLKVKYRLEGESIWTSYLIASSGTTTTSFVGDNNRIYDIQVQNLNSSDNPLSLISQAIGFTDPAPAITPTNTGVGYSFSNLSVDIDTYSVSITTSAAPGTIIATHVLPAGTFPGTVSDTFTGLQALTTYRMVITPVANQFSESFIHLFTTAAVAECPAVINVVATIS